MGAMPTVVLVKNGREQTVSTPRGFVDAVYGQGYVPKVGTLASNWLALAGGPSPTPVTNRVVRADTLATELLQAGPRSALEAAFSPVGADSGPARAFAGVIAVLRRGMRSTCIGMVSDSTGDDKNAGNPVDEWPRALVRKLGADYPAYTVVEKNWNDATQSYDPPTVLQTGTGGGERGVVFAKATPGSMQYPGVAATTGLDIQMQIKPGAWTDSADRTLLSKWESGTNQRSLLFLLGANGSLALNHSATGAAGFGQKTSTATIPGTVAPAANATLWVRATMTLDNGAGGHDVKFFTSTDGATWTQLGTTVTTAGTTTLFGGTAPYQLGALGGGLATPYFGTIYRVRVYGAVDGKASLVPPLLDDWDNYATTSEKLNFVGAPVLTLLNGGQSGQNVAYFDNATRRTVLHQPHGQAVVIVSSAHNDGTQARQVWLNNYSTLVNNIKALLPGVPILCLAQNQTGPGGTFNLTPQDVEHRATRGAMVQQWAASQGGVYSFDVWPLTKPTDTVDQLHPSTGAGSGSEKWATGLYRQLPPRV